MKKAKILLFFLTALLLTGVLVFFCYASADSSAPALTETIPFEVTTAEDTVVTVEKPEYEDLSSRFLTMEKVVVEAFPESMVTALSNNFSRVYATLAEYFNYGVMYDIVYTIDEQTSAAYQTGGRNDLEKKIAMNASYFRTNRNDLGALTHELTHAMQSYKDSKYGAANSANGGSWLTEGVADFGRYTFDLSSFSLPNYSADQKYTDSYRVTARFFLWLNQNVDSTFLEQFNEGLKCEAYTAQLFVKITGKTVDELWQMYAESDHVIR